MQTRTLMKSSLPGCTTRSYRTTPIRTVILNKKFLNNY